MIGLLEPLAGLAGKIIDELYETDEEKAQARAKLMKAEQAGRLSEMRLSIEAILAEARSKDKWTSRARPTFLYVMYAIIVLCFVGGIVSIWFPMQAQMAAYHAALLLRAIPEQLWWLFGAGYLGYTGARSFDKWRASDKDTRR